MLEYGLSFPNVYLDAPFHDENWQLVRSHENKKAFLWTYERNGNLCINIKVDPEWRDLWRNAYESVLPVYHQNKEHWNTVILDGIVPEEEIKNHFPNIAAKCMEMGYDVTKECIPVVPAQHYFMGGIKVDHESRTSMEGLYAIGETACNGVHGKNRLASNSLLESLVFAGRAARDIIDRERAAAGKLPEVDLTAYEDKEALAEEYSRLVLDEIKRSAEERNKDVR